MKETNYGLVLEQGRMLVVRAPRASFFDPRFLVAALLEHVAQGDGHVCERETQTMISLVAGHFSLPPEQAEQRFVQALGLYARSLDLAETGQVLVEILDPGERLQVVVMLLEVIAADGRQGVDELAALDEVAQALAITPEERHAAFAIYFEGAADRGKRRIHMRRKSTL